MRQVKVNAYEKALVFKNDRLVQVLDSGKYWVNPWRKVVKYDVTELFYHEIDIDFLMKHENFASRVDVIDVGDSEVAIQYKNGNFHEVLGTCRYVYWKDGLDYTHDIYDMNDVAVDKDITPAVMQKLAACGLITVQLIAPHDLGLLYIDGELVKEVGPGNYYFWRGVRDIALKRVDIRKQLIEVSGQELLTSDKAAIRMSLFADYKVIDVNKALTEIKDYAKQLYVTLQLGLREYVGQYTLDQLLRNKAAIAPYILEYAQDRFSELGVELINCGIRDIILPGDIKEIMNQVLVAEKKAQANTIMRREETASTRSLLNTAKLMEDNEMLFKLKEMEYMEKIADKVGEISLNGGGRVVDQLRELVGSK